MRPGNAFMAAVGVWVGIALATYGTWLSAIYFLVDEGARQAVWLATPLAALCIAGAGNVVNDIRDRHIDALAHPDRPLPAGTIRVADAWLWAAMLLILGIWSAWSAGGAALAGLASINAGLLAGYEVWAKRRGLAGNALVGILVGSTFIFGGWAWSGLEGAQAALPLAIMASLATLAREIVKDIEDMHADGSHRRTWPMTVGPRWALVTALVAVACAVAYSVWDATVRGTIPVAWSLAPGIAFAAAMAVSAVDVSRGQRLLKLAMLLALLTYLGPGLTARL